MFTRLALACVVSSFFALAAPVPERALWVDGRANAGGNGSPQAPFATVGAALKAVQPGGTVVVKAGVYRESVAVPGGTPAQPTVLMAAPGERVVLSGMRPVTGWEAAGNGVYRATVKTAPARLFVGFRKQPLSREPNEGWWVAETIQQEEKSGTLTSRSLLGSTLDVVGGEAYIWSQQGNNFFTVPVTGLDPQTGSLAIGINNKWLKLKDGDKFYLVNHPALIDQPGEWSANGANGTCEVHFRPRNDAELAQVEVPVESRRVLLVAQPHVRVTGIDVTGSNAQGIELSRCQDILLEDCRAYLNDLGIGVRDCQNVRVRHCLSFHNEGNGVSLHTTTAAVVEENEIAWNGVDGLVVTWNSHDVDVRRNYIHDHLLWGHPDNIQMYREVSNVRVVENLLLAGGQTVMMEQAHDLLFQGNMFVGCGANMLIFGHGNAGDARIISNTFAFPGYSCLALSEKDYEVRSNIFAMGHGGSYYSIRGVEGYQGDHNLFWAGNGQQAGIVDNTAWHRDFASYRKGSPALDVHSQEGDPAFASAPVAYAVLDDRRLSECTRSQLYLRDGNGERFAVGDIAETNFDGVKRQVLAVDKASITIDPPLAEKPPKPYVVANWKSGETLVLDLRPSPGSPALTLGPDGKAIGSSLDIPAFRRGDFNADGQRDLPAYPPDVTWRPQ